MRLVYGALCLALSCVSTSCGRSGQPDCARAIERYWRSIEVHSYFSAISMADAVKSCESLEDKSVVACVNEAASPERISECAGLDTLVHDRGWKRGVYCYAAEEESRLGRCERSNRECDYYRRVANRKREKVSRCKVHKRAWAVLVGGKAVEPQGSPEACELVRKDLASRGKIAGESCQEIGYEELLPHRHVIPGAH